MIRKVDEKKDKGQVCSFCGEDAIWIIESPRDCSECRSQISLCSLHGAIFVEELSGLGVVAHHTSSNMVKAIDECNRIRAAGYKPHLKSIAKEYDVDFDDLMFQL